MADPERTGSLFDRSQSPFRITYLNPGSEGVCDQRFIELCRANFGYSPDGAKRHFELLQRLPEGYEYWGKVPRAYAEQLSQGDPSTIIVEGPVFDSDGEPVEGEVALGHKIPPIPTIDPQ